MQPATRDTQVAPAVAGPHGVRIRGVPALRCHITPKFSALKFKQIRNLGLKVHRRSQFAPTESLGWVATVFKHQTYNKWCYKPTTTTTKRKGCLSCVFSSQTFKMKHPQRSGNNLKTDPRKTFFARCAIVPADQPLTEGGDAPASLRAPGVSVFSAIHGNWLQCVAVAWHRHWAVSSPVRRRST